MIGKIFDTEPARALDLWVLFFEQGYYKIFIA